MMQTLQVLVDETLREQFGSLLQDWANCVQREKNFERIVWNWVPRATTLAPDRHEKVLLNMGLIRQVRPSAIQIFGAVALPASGHGMPDGHVENHSVLWSDVPYAFVDVPMEDKMSLVTTGTDWQKNVAGDDRADRSYYTGFTPSGPVARVDFSDLIGIATQPTKVQCYEGPLVPRIDERVAMEQYLRKNIAYRTGRFSIEPNVIWMQRPGLERTKTQYKAELSRLPWIDVPSELPNPALSARFVFSGVMPEVYWYFLDPARDCQEMRALVRINYRSNAWEVRGYRQGLVRALLYGCMVSLWGMEDWHFWPHSPFVGEDLRLSWQRFTPAGGGVTGVPVQATVMGDLTLPYVVQSTTLVPVVGLRLET